MQYQKGETEPKLKARMFFTAESSAEQLLFSSQRQFFSLFDRVVNFSLNCIAELVDWDQRVAVREQGVCLDDVGLRTLEVLLDIQVQLLEYYEKRCQTLEEMVGI